MIQDTIWWHVYPLGATGAPVRDRAGDDSGHRLRHLGPWLDYLVELGCDGLLLGPIFESVGHGYDTLDHYRIDSRLGTDEDVEWLIAECDSRGIKVMLDGVFNHVARTHPAVGQGLAGSTNWEGHEELATLHHDDERVRELVTDIMLHWLRRGISGWRLDVAYAVPSDFWADVLTRVRGEFPDALILGEVIHGDYAGIATAGKMDSVTQYELWKAIWSSLVDANFFELDHALGRHRAMLAEIVPNTFIGNHDVDRIASKVGQAKAVIAAALLFTLPGMPSIYYGDEQGFEGLRTEGFEADDAVRTALPASPDELSPLGGWLYTQYQALIGLRRRNPWLTRADLEVREKTNETITVRVFNSAQELLIDACLAPTPGVRVHAGGETLYEWHAS
ncbi:alpha-amylase family protein [Corynebacterium liangguodongii]|uniref:Alpha-amylase n=1 Tax=Corynebacterium liangguodongii TaxID=2079535 RepID=A0A2S0WBH9_9CORY|nr:alpha-amylase family protein [Corynebacterium liangguodongii]AWB83115.1 alpha-amylase [Corynebacterium liangguodongii]PWB99284.1 alpha-amylase [Corynebacterium liangguodongii]